MIVIFAGLIGAYLVYLFYKSQGYYDPPTKSTKPIETNNIQKNSEFNSNINSKMNFFIEENKIIRFGNYIKNLKNTHSNLDISGPLSNGDYSIYFNDPKDDLTKVIIFPNLQQNSGEMVMDLIIIPQKHSYDLVGEYDITYLLSHNMPGNKYLYDRATIERSMSRTACIRLSFKQDIIYNDKKFVKAIYYLNRNSHEIFGNLSKNL